MDFSNKAMYVPYPGIEVKRKVRKANYYKIYAHNRAVNKQQGMIKEERADESN